MNVRFPSNWGVVIASGLLLCDVVCCPWMLWYFPYLWSKCSKLWSRKHLGVHDPNTPKFGCPTCCKAFYCFNSRLLRYSKPIHPSPLAFILLLLEFIFFGLLYLCVVVSQCLIDNPASWQMNSAMAHLGTQIYRADPCFQLIWFSILLFTPSGLSEASAYRSGSSVIKNK